LALTLCEHYNWNTPGRQLKVNSALELLSKEGKLGELRTFQSELTLWRALYSPALATGARSLYSRTAGCQRAFFLLSKWIGKRLTGNAFER